MADRYLLTDVGGSRTRMGLATPDGLIPDTTRSHANVEFDGLPQLLGAYLESMHPCTVRALCAGVAGPVRGGTAQLTNHDWFIDNAELQAATGAEHVHLINDLQAQGYALDDLSPDSITTLISGTPADPDATRLVIGLGTGCNIAVVHRIGGQLFVPPSESGHTSLPHATGQTGALIDHLTQSFPHGPIEAALSGPGLSRIHSFFSGNVLPPDQIIAAYEDGDPTATETLHFFARLFGTVAGNLALAHLPIGGIYLIGGTARAVAPYLIDLGFDETFTAKGPYTQIMQDIPIFLVQDDTAALRGCARYVRQSLK